MKVIFTAGTEIFPELTGGIKMEKNIVIIISTIWQEDFMWPTTALLGMRLKQITSPSMESDITTTGTLKASIEEVRHHRGYLDILIF